MALKNSSSKVAVITADLIASRSYSSEQRAELDTLLRQAFDTATQRLSADVYMPMSFNVVRGDEFQLVLNDVNEAYPFVVFMRTLLANSALRPTPRFRASIGIGELAVSHGDTSYAMDGSAFHYARDGLDALGKSHTGRMRLSALRTGDAKMDDLSDLLLMYQDLFESRWTPAQCEAIRWRFEALTYEKIGEKLGVALQNIQKRLHAAYWDEFSRGMDFIKGSISPFSG